MNTENIKELKPIPLGKLSPNPLVSVLMVNYNYSAFIGEAIESVLNQTYRKWELIICDDGSTDNSVEIIEKYQKKDSRIKLIKKENGGQASALNAAYSKAKGKIISILDSDDVFYEDKLEKVVNEFTKNWNSGFCIHKMLPINQKGKQINKAIPVHLSHGWTGEKALKLGGGNNSLPPASGLSFRKEITNLIFPLPLEFDSNADALLAELPQYLTLIISINQHLTKFRFHSKNTSSHLKSPTENSIIKMFRKSRAITQIHKKFISKTFGGQFSSLLNCEDRPGYWQAKLALYILNRKRTTNGEKVSDILSRINNKFSKMIWLFILILPKNYSIKALRFWWSPAPFKKYLVLLSKLTSR